MIPTDLKNLPNYALTHIYIYIYTYIFDCNPNLKCYVYNIFTTNFKWQIITDFNMPSKFYCENIIAQHFFSQRYWLPSGKKGKKEEAPYYFPREVVVGKQGLKMSARMVFLIWLRDFGGFAKGGGGLGWFDLLCSLIFTLFFFFFLSLLFKCSGLWVSEGVS